MFFLRFTGTGQTALRVLVRIQTSKVLLRPGDPWDAQEDGEAEKDEDEDGDAEMGEDELNEEEGEEEMIEEKTEEVNATGEPGDLSA